jgi:ABC-type multidrug transport system ATPase subunit
VTEPAPLAELRDVSVRYGAKQALEGVDLEILPGCLYAVVGANGSGKSSLLKLLAGRLVPSAGAVRFGEALGLGDASRSRSIGYAAQTAELDPEMTAREHLKLFAALCKLPAASRSTRIEAVSAQLGLAEFLDTRVDACSGGMRQRLHLALSMLHAPTLWLLDEPFTALDPQAQNLLWSALSEHARSGGASLVVSHDLGRVAACADRVVILEGGRLLVNAPPFPLATAHGDMERAYEALTGRRVGELRPHGAGKGRGPRA